MLSVADTLQTKMLSLATAYDPGTGDTNRNGEIQEDLKDCITNLFANKKVEFPYNKLDPATYDLKTRPIGTGMQIVFENALIQTLLDNRNIKAVAIIHTRMPSTPLCNEPGQPVSNSLISPVLSNGEASKNTVIKRTGMLRELAKIGENTDLFITYQAGGLSQRDQAQKEIYKKECSNPKNKSLHDVELNLETMPEELIGASYLINNGIDDNWQAFLVKAVQAKDAGASNTEWTYWFGSLTDETVAPRYQAVKLLFQESPALKPYLP